MCAGSDIPCSYDIVDHIGYTRLCYMYALTMCILCYTQYDFTGQVEVTTESDCQLVQYSAKIINPENKGGYNHSSGMA